MNRYRLTFVLGVAAMAGVMVLIIAVGTLTDLSGAGLSLSRLNTFSYTEARFVSDLTNRGLNQLLALTFTVVAIAVPLTANLYSLKFLEFFIKDRVNAAVLALVVLADLASFWLVVSLKEDFTPRFQLYLSFGLLLLCLGVLFPYLHYVFRFLHPTTLLHRLEDEINTALVSARQRPARVAAYRQLVADGLEHVANIAVRSIERTDRATAVESIFTLERVARAYWAQKESLPPVWFQADSQAFLGFSTKAVNEFTESRTWVEMKLFSQLRGILSAAVPRTHDVADTVARALRHLGLEPVARANEAVRELVVAYFNTAVRLALTRRDAHTAFTVLENYTLYALAMNAEQPKFVQELAFYFDYYGQLARDRDQPFIAETAAHDLGALTQHAWETQAPNRQRLLERFLNVDSKDKTPLPGVKKAQARLASYLMLAGHDEQVAQMREEFAGLPRAFIEEIADDLLHVRREKYWEIGGRRTNIDYVPDAQREMLRQFFEGLLVSGRIAPAAANASPKETSP
jgi:hypothetical protein